MTFDAIMFLTEAERFITFNGTCKVNLVFNFRLPSKEKTKQQKTTILTSFISCEIAQGLLESLDVVQLCLNK